MNEDTIQLDRGQPVHFQVHPQAKPVRPAGSQANGAARAWSPERVLALLQQPFMNLVQQAHAVHCEHFPREQSLHNPFGVWRFHAH